MTPTSLATPTCKAFVLKVESFGILPADEFFDEATESRGEESLGSFEGSFDEVAAQVVKLVPEGLTWKEERGFNVLSAPLGGNLRIEVQVYLTFGDAELPELEEMDAPLKVVAAALATKPRTFRLPFQSYCCKCSARIPAGSLAVHKKGVGLAHSECEGRTKNF